jgi:predicted DCC family thiol-disulfide oxidoreductase YuxK
MQTTNTVRGEPLLIYDGDCRFCIYWARYWERLTGHRVTYGKRL